MNNPKPSVRFPGESDSYRTARNELLNEEIELRQHIEAVAAKRRLLPLGGTLPEDYVLAELGEDRKARAIRLSQLFSDGQDTLIIYSFMYGPKMAEPCPNCTSILDALDGEVPHVTQRVGVAVIAKSPIARSSVALDQAPSAYLTLAQAPFVLQTPLPPRRASTARWL